METKKTTFIILAVLFVSVIGIMTARTFSDKRSGSLSFADGNAMVANLYKSPMCGCCGVYSSYIKDDEYALNIEDIEDMSIIKKRFGVPVELESCHTTEIDGYVVEGHIPKEAIQKLLTERPDIKGIGMAGMPMGSPGMPGRKAGDFVIYEITRDGTQGEVFATL